MYKLKFYSIALSGFTQHFISIRLTLCIIQNQSINQKLCQSLQKIWVNCKALSSYVQNYKKKKSYAIGGVFVSSRVYQQILLVAEPPSTNFTPVSYFHSPNTHPIRYGKPSFGLTYNIGRTQRQAKSILHKWDL